MTDPRVIDPDADLQALVEQWRVGAKRDARLGVSQALKSKREYFGCVNAALAMADCADRLAALLPIRTGPEDLAIAREELREIADELNASHPHIARALRRLARTARQQAQAIRTVPVAETKDKQ